MRAIKLEAEVGSSRSLRLELPEDVPMGLAEVIVLVPEESPPTSQTVAEFLATLRINPAAGRSKEQIDRELDGERASWD